jgi:hypothetical protein
MEQAVPPTVVHDDLLPGVPRWLPVLTPDPGCHPGLRIAESVKLSIFVLTILTIMGDRM